MNPTKPLRERRRLLTVVLVNCIVTLLLVEIVCVVAYYLKTDALYYLDEPRAEDIPEHPESAANAYLIHPYFGFIFRPQLAWDGQRVNNYGFGWPADYPHQGKSPEDIVVGLFGGSVAAKLNVYEQNHAVIAGRIAQELGIEQHHISVLNFAQGGYKQPQQALILAYFLTQGQHFDLVINLDGFNDVALAGRNLASGVSASMPSFEHTRALQALTPMTADRQALDRLLKIRSSWSAYATSSNRAWGRRGWESRFAAGFGINWLFSKLHHRRHVSLRLAYSESLPAGDLESWFHLNPSNAPAHDPSADALAPAVQLWGHASRLMHVLATSAGAEYIHVLQPNQYYRTSRVMDENEREVAVSETSPYPPLVEVGYPLLEQEIERLRASGVSAHSLTEIFDSVERAVYADNCCHYTDLGQQILAAQIGELSAQALSAGPSD